jgi:uncharacterized membrane protein YoaK (UPF0700 family)
VEFLPTNIRQTDKWLSLGLAFVGGYGDAASFVVAQTFTGHVTGNLPLTIGALCLAIFRPLALFWLAFSLLRLSSALLARGNRGRCFRPSWGSK